MDEKELKFNSLVSGFVKNHYDIASVPSEIISLVVLFYRYVSDQRVHVICRLRPQNHREIKQNCFIVAVKKTDKLLVTYNPAHPSISESFRFDHIFKPSCSQSDVYQHIGPPFLDSILDGCNASIVAYGQTSAGKTYTISGSEADQGFLPRTIAQLFDKISCTPKYMEYEVRVSYIEIYCEKVRDLLHADPYSTNLKLRANPNGVYIEGITEKKVNDSVETLQVLKDANRQRMIAMTTMGGLNIPARSHVIFMLNLTQTNTRKGSTSTSCAKFFDLAGSEKVHTTGASASLLREARGVGLSHSALKNVISSVVSKNRHVIPWRDSQLTRLMKDEIAGDCLTYFIMNCSPSSYNADETIRTCRFAQRVFMKINQAEKK